MEHKLIDGVQVPLTAEEIAQRQVNDFFYTNDYKYNKTRGN
jgi:hypothetical protein